MLKLILSIGLIWGANQSFANEFEKILPEGEPFMLEEIFCEMFHVSEFTPYNADKDFKPDKIESRNLLKAVRESWKDKADKNVTYHKTVGNFVNNEGKSTQEYTAYRSTTRYEMDGDKFREVSHIDTISKLLGEDMSFEDGEKIKKFSESYMYEKETLADGSIKTLSVWKDGVRVDNFNTYEIVMKGTDGRSYSASELRTPEIRKNAYGVFKRIHSKQFCMTEATTK